MDPRIMAAILWGLGVACAVRGLTLTLARADGASRVDRLGLTSSQAAAPGRFTFPWLARAAARLEAWRPDDVRRLVILLDQSGLAGQIPPTRLVLIKAIGLLTVPALVVLDLPVLASGGLVALVVACAVAAGAWYAPELYLVYRRGGYRKSVAASLPTVIDLLTMNLQSGMGLERALRLITDRVQSPTSAELRRMLGDIDLGLARRDALRRLADRVGLEELHVLTSAVVQSDELGVHLADSLQSYARDLRLSRRRAAEAAALRAPVKMVFPMVLFLLPSLALVLFAPVIINMFEG